MRVLAVATVVLGLAGVARAELDRSQIRKVIKAHILETFEEFRSGAG
jgi:hypothetical protein